MRSKPTARKLVPDLAQEENQHYAPEEFQEHTDFISNNMPQSLNPKDMYIAHSNQDPNVASDVREDKMKRARTYPCDHCDQVFLDSNSLRDHVSFVHEDVHSHVCQECGRTFATSSGLKQHQHIHRSVKPFKCEVCHKAYTQFSNLCRHKRISSGCRQEVFCEVCQGPFPNMTALHKHRRVCSGTPASSPQDSPSPPATTQWSPMTPGMMSTKPSAAPAPGGFPGMFMPMMGARPPFPFFPPFGMGMPPMSQPLVPMTLPVKTEIASPPVSNEHTQPLVPVPIKTEMPSPPVSYGYISTQQQVSSNGTKDIAKLMTSEVSDFKNNTVNAIRGIKRPRSPDFGDENQPHAKKQSPARDAPIDFSKVKQMTPISVNVKADPFSTGDDLPLDLSIGSSKIAHGVPRKTHIFGTVKHDNVPMLPTRALYSQSPVAPQNTSLLVKASTPVFAPRIHSPKAHPADQHKFFASPGHFPFHATSPGFGSMAPVPVPPPMLSVPQQPAGRQSILPTMSPDSANSGSSGKCICTYCGRDFPRTANLKRHMRTHTGERPFGCMFCDRSFSISSNLQRHLRKVHSNYLPLRCPTCDRGFAVQSSLEKHMKQHSLGANPVFSDSSCGGTSTDWEATSDTESGSSGISPGKDITPNPYSEVSPGSTDSSQGPNTLPPVKPMASRVDTSDFDHTSEMCDSFDEEEGELVIDENTDEIIDVV